MEEEVCRKKYDSDDSKRRLLKAALNTFSKLGYDAATTKEISKSAGVNESLIHRYFKNKLGLFFAVLHEHYRSINEELPYPPSSTVKEEIANFIRYRRQFCIDKKKFMKILITRALVDPKVRDEVGALHRNGVPSLTQRLAGLAKAGKIRAEVNVEHMGIMISGIAFSMNMFTDMISTLDPKASDSITDLFVDLMDRSLGPR